MTPHFRHMGLGATCNWTKLLPDLHNGYWQVELNPRPDQGLFYHPPGDTVVMSHALWIL